MDKYRLVMPPTLFVALAAPFWKLAHTVFFYNWYAATAVYCGGVFGYVCYDLTHYFLHHRKLVPLNTCADDILTFVDCHRIINRSRSITSNTTLPITRMALE